MYHILAVYDHINLAHRYYHFFLLVTAPNVAHAYDSDRHRIIGTITSSISIPIAIVCCLAWLENFL